MTQSRSVCESMPSSLGLPPNGLPGMLAPTSLDRFELLQTPGLWGHDPADNAYWQPADGPSPRMPAASRRLLEAIEDVISSARTQIDISSLQSCASGAFAAAIRRGLSRAAAETTGPLRVRVLYGYHGYTRPGFPDETEADFDEFFRGLTADLAAEANVRVEGCFMKTSLDAKQPSWNHAKIIAADGRRAIVGGHNLWHDDYLSFAPVHDVSAMIEGQAAGEAHRFLDHLWQWATEHSANPSDGAFCHTTCWASGRISHEPASLPTPLPQQGGSAAPGGIPALALGRLGIGVVADAKVANAAAAVPAVLFAQARSSIRLSQQDFGLMIDGVNYWRDDIVDALVAALTASDRSVDVSLVLSEVGAEVAVGGTYSFGTTYADVIGKMRAAIGDRPVTGRMRLAPLRCGERGERWQHDGRELMFANHAKVWIVDDRLVHVGSDNIYPHGLQEFGYVIDSEETARDVITRYWEPLWRYSSRRATDVC